MFTKNIRSWIDILKEGELFFAKQTYEDYFEDMQENTFYQLLARLCKEKLIKNISKGLYYKPYSNDFDKEPSTENIIDFLTNRGRNGCVVGGDDYKKLGIVDEDVNYTYVFTNLLRIKSIRKILDLSIFYLDVEYRNDAYYRTIQCLELLEHLDELDNVNPVNLYNYLRDFADKYNEAAFVKVINLRGYKKRVIAALQIILDHFGIENRISKFLNKASKYKIPEVLYSALEVK